MRKMASSYRRRTANRSTTSDMSSTGDTPSALANSSIVFRLGWRNPRSSKEMYVRSKPLSNPRPSWVRPLVRRSSASTRPKAISGSNLFPLDSGEDRLIRLVTSEDYSLRTLYGYWEDSCL